MAAKTHTTSERQQREARQRQILDWLADHATELERLNSQRDTLDQQFRFYVAARGSTPAAEKERQVAVKQTALHFAEIESAIIARQTAADTLRLEMLPDPPDPAALAAAEQAASEAIASRDLLRQQTLETQQARGQLERSLHALGKQEAEARSRVAQRRRQMAQAGTQPLAVRRLVIAS